MFSVRQKRKIADQVQAVLRATGHPELPDGEIRFQLTVFGAESWSWARIENNAAVVVPGVNPHNEAADGDKQSAREGEGRRAMTKQLIDELRKAAKCMYLAADKSVAHDLSDLLVVAAITIDKLTSKETELKDRILDWLLYGDVGESSTAMATALLDKPYTGAHPRDAEDFVRCVKFLEVVGDPGVAGWQKIASMTKNWSKLVDTWPVLLLALQDGGSSRLHDCLKILLVNQVNAENAVSTDEILVKCRVCPTLEGGDAKEDEPERDGFPYGQI